MVAGLTCEQKNAWGRLNCTSSRDFWRSSCITFSTDRLTIFIFETFLALCLHGTVVTFTEGSNEGERGGEEVEIDGKSIVGHAINA